ncbi:MAG: redoxin domain-containing protein [Bacteroidota bacterium]
MRNLIIAGLLVLGFACSQQKGYKIEVSLEGAEGVLVLEQRDGNRFVVRDSARFTDGKAILQGKVDFPEVYFMSIQGTNQRGLIFVENVKMKVSGSADSLRFVRVSGSPVNDEYQAIRAELDADSERGMARYQEYQLAVQQGNPDAGKIMEEVRAIFDQQEEKMVQFIQNNPKSWVNPILLEQVQQGREPGELEALIQSLDPAVREVAAVKAIVERLEKLKAVAIGQVAPDFVQNDPEGNPVRLSEVYAKNAYTLIDFWAAWCGPCRMENPNIVAVYNDYKDKGFSVFGVSLDRSREDWLKAIEDDKLTWDHVSDLQYWQNEAAALYSVNSIPASFLVDREGKIVAKNLRDEALREKIAELLP